MKKKTIELCATVRNIPQEGRHEPAPSPSAEKLQLTLLAADGQLYTKRLTN